MRFSVIANTGEKTLGSVLEKAFGWAESVDLASAFITQASLKRLRRALEIAASEQRKLRIRLLTGLYQRFNAPEALKEALAIQRDFPGGFEIRISKNRRFHWKMYLCQQSRQYLIYTGSANFTEDGLTTSGEIGTTFNNDQANGPFQKMKELFDEEWNAKKSFNPDYDFITRYENIKRPVHIETGQDDWLSKLLSAPQRQVRSSSPDEPFPDESTDPITTNQPIINREITADAPLYVRILQCLRNDGRQNLQVVWGKIRDPDAQSGGKDMNNWIESGIVQIVDYEGNARVIELTDRGEELSKKSVSAIKEEYREAKEKNHGRNGPKQKEQSALARR